MAYLQTIVSSNDAIPILKALPLDLHPYIYQFITDEVKVHYWMDKYDWTDTIRDIGGYYHGLYIVDTYFRHLNEGNNAKHLFFVNANAYREKGKARDAYGRVIRMEWYWNDDYCDYDKIFDQLGDMIYKQYEERRDICGLYKLLAHLITLWDDKEKANFIKELDM
jgi:hypothetical protein